MSTQPMYMTANGFSKIEAALARLKVQREDLAETLADCIDGGDSIDNTEYLIMRDEADLVQARILELEEILRYAELIQLGEADGKVHLGNSVAIQTEGEPLESYTIVGSAEADPCAGCISNKSPLGRALLEREVGDEVTIAAPDGEITFRIIAVT